MRSCLYVTDHGEKCLSFKHHCLTSQLSKTFSSRPHIWTTSIFLHVLCSKVLTSLASIIICSPSTPSGYIHHRCTSVSYCVTSSIIFCSPSTLSGYIHHRLSLFPPVLRRIWRVHYPNEYGRVCIVQPQWAFLSPLKPHPQFRPGTHFEWCCLLKLCSCLALKASSSNSIHVVLSSAYRLLL